jgi:hypothetical protein
VKTLGGHLVLGRVDADRPDPRFRLTPLGDGLYGLSLYDRNRWDPPPYDGTLNELVDCGEQRLGSLGRPLARSPFMGASNLRNSVLI